MRKIVFISGTRADYGKIKPILRVIHDNEDMQLHVFVTGMHMLEKFGHTHKEIVKDDLGLVYCDEDYHYEQRMDVALANVMKSFSIFVRITRPDLIVIHGDRLEALAGALVGAFNNILVAHIEGGELSGTIDESIRHAVSKFAHLHFVSNEEAAIRLMQLGEPMQSIHVIGSPDIDIMLRDDLPHLDQVKSHYDIPFRDYAIVLYHPVVTEQRYIKEHANALVNTLKNSGEHYVVIYPNNDPGNEIIRQAYESLAGDASFRVIPSMRFEYFLTLLRHSRFIIGNSSAGIREACVYGVPAIDLGSRQRGRYNTDILKNVMHLEYDVQRILSAIGAIARYRVSSTYFGAGDSAETFYSILQHDAVWNTPKQKRFIDMKNMAGAQPFSTAGIRAAWEEERRHAG